VEHQRPDPVVAVGVPAAASGFHVLHAAATVLGVIKPNHTPEELVARVTNEKTRKRIENCLAGDGFTDHDLRALGDA
jgi:hypothetical protein